LWIVVVASMALKNQILRLFMMHHRQANTRLGNYE